MKARTKTKRYAQGFSLIEMMVAVGIFTVVMVMSIGSVLTIVGANDKAQSIKSVVNNLSITLENMARNVRTGSTYWCNGSGTTNDATFAATKQDCVGGGTLIIFEPQFGNRTLNDDQLSYRLGVVSGNGFIERRIGSGSTFERLTSDQVNIEFLRFYVSGQASGDRAQPFVRIVMQGTANVAGKITRFNIQTAATQRLLDVQ